MARRETKNDRLETVYARLKPSGFTKQVIHDRILPEWWDDAIADSDAGFGQFLVLMARNMGFTPESLEDTLGPFESSDTLPARLRSRRDTTASDVWVTLCVTTRAAQLAVASMESEYRPLPDSARYMREEILRSGANLVNLPTLLNYCFTHGIPVIHIPDLPASKMEGTAVMVHGRPAIVLLKNARFSAEFLFTIAHEIGHIVLGHLHEDGYHFDILADDPESGKVSSPSEEHAANTFANILLGLSQVSTERLSFRAPALLRAYARKVGEALSIDAGALVRYVAQTKGLYQLAYPTLSIVEPDASPSATIRSVMRKWFNFDQLSGESAEYLQRITGLEEIETSEALAA